MHYCMNVLRHERNMLGGVSALRVCVCVSLSGLLACVMQVVCGASCICVYVCVHVCVCVFVVRGLRPDLWSLPGWV